MVIRVQTILGEWWLRCDKCRTLIKVYETERQLKKEIKECPGYDKKTKTILCLDCYKEKTNE